jgi:RNA polymerase sigma-70 factor (ECF subfamily)
VSSAAPCQQRQIVEAFSRGVSRRRPARGADDPQRRRAALLPGRAAEVRGAPAVPDEITVFRRGVRFAAPALVSGIFGALVAPRGRLQLVVRFDIDADTIVAYELIADLLRLQQLDLAALGT